jgi:outer membrane protein assembly factor BamB
VDSSALLDDKGRVYVASCDGFTYALNREDGSELWRQRAHTIPECHDKGVESFVDWFEGHIALDKRGTLIVPNDNFHTYAFDRDTGHPEWQFLTGDQTWSCPAYNPRTDRLFMGTNYFVLRNLFAFSAIDGARIWKKGTLGSMVASPLLTSLSENGLVVAGGFDGIVRAFKQKNGRQVWKFGCRDHIYASPVQAADGTVIQASADGSIYALSPADGSLRWVFDTPEPIRSTPAIDGAGNIYFGNGEGKLYCLSGRGELRWTYQCVDSDRCDVNSSPAIGAGAVVVGADDGSIVRIPFEYPVSATGRRDPRCEVSPGVVFPVDGSRLFMLSKYGKLHGEPKERLKAHEPLTLSLVVRGDSRTRTALIDRRSVRVTTDAGIPLRTAVSADKRFITVVPGESWTAKEGGGITVTVSGDYRVRPRRFGLKLFGGRKGGTFSQTFRFDVEPHMDGPSPFTTATGPGRPCSVLEIGRLAPALPTILPSYNQLGFDSIHYHLGFVEGTDPHALLWGVGAALTGGGEERSVVDPESPIRFVVHASYDGGLLTLSSEEGFTLEFNGWDIPYDLFRIATYKDEAGFAPGWMSAAVRCDEIAFYGPFLKVLGVSDLRTGMMYVSGAAGRVRHLGVHELPTQMRDALVEVSGDRNRVSAKIDVPIVNHALGLLLIDESSGDPLPLNYTKVTSVTRDPESTTVSVALPERATPPRCRYYVLADALPLSSGSISL